MRDLFLHVTVLAPVSNSNGVNVRSVSFGLALSDSNSLMMKLFLMVVVSFRSLPSPYSHVADLPLLQQLS